MTLLSKKLFCPNFVSPFTSKIGHGGSQKKKQQPKNKKIKICFDKKLKVPFIRNGYTRG